MSTRPTFTGDRATTRVVVAVSLSAFAEWGGASAVLPLLPVYLRRHGSSVALVGLTMAAFFIAALVVQYPLGRLSDRVGRRHMQIGGLLTYSIATVLFAFVSAPLAALLFRALQGAGTGIVDVANAATIGEVVPPSRRGRAYGALYGMRTVGMAVGPFLGGLAGFAGMRFVFLAAALVVLVAVLPLLRLSQQRRPALVVRSGGRVALWRSRSVIGVVIAFLATGVIIGMYEVCWSLLLNLRGASSFEIGLSWTLFAFPFGVVSFPAGWLVDHMDRRYLVAISLFGTAAFASAYPFIHSVVWLMGLGVAEASMVALGAPAYLSQLSHSVRPDELGRAQGAASSVQTGATAVAAVFAGALFGLHYWLPFELAGVVIGVLIVAMSVAWRGVPGTGSVVEPSEEPALSPRPELRPEPAGECAG
jgi:DHA1 family multidrug resistance protein-like MFS transporter